MQANRSPTTSPRCCQMDGTYIVVARARRESPWRGTSESNVRKIAVLHYPKATSRNRLSFAGQAPVHTSFNPSRCTRFIWH